MGFSWEGWRADVTKKAAYQNDGTGGKGSRCPVPGQGGGGGLPSEQPARQSLTALLGYTQAFSTVNGLNMG